MKWIWCEYDVDGGFQSYPTACPQWEPHSKSYDWPNQSDGMVWCCGNMTTSHGWRLLNTFYRYEVDPVWVWSGWEVLIISYSMSPMRNPLKILRLCPLHSDGMVWRCGIITASHGWRLLNTFYRYEVDLVGVWSGWEVPIISYSMSPVRNQLKILRHCLKWWYGLVLWHYDCQPQ